MRERGVMLVCMVVMMLISMAAGCESLRFGPGEVQKQNTYLHHRTVQSAALQARSEQASEALCELTSQAARQSEAIVAYYGLPGFDNIGYPIVAPTLLDSANEEQKKKYLLPMSRGEITWCEGGLSTIKKKG